MKNNILSLAILVSITFLSCKGKKDNNSPDVNNSTPEKDKTEVPNSGSAAAVASLNIVASPDSVVVGKNNEVVIKVKNIKAINLSDPDGKVTGMEFTYDLQVTNKSAINGGASAYVNPQNFRLELDNGTKISNTTYNTVSVSPESTASSTDNKFELDPGVKPTALDLFYDETRAVIQLKEK